MNEPAKSRATYDDLLALPDDLVGEILNGTLHAQPRPAPRHASAASRLGATVTAEFDDGPASRIRTTTCVAADCARLRAPVRRRANHDGGDGDAPRSIRRAPSRCDA